MFSLVINYQLKFKNTFNILSKIIVQKKRRENAFQSILFILSILSDCKVYLAQTHRVIMLVL